MRVGAEEPQRLAWPAPSTSGCVSLRALLASLSPAGASLPWCGPLLLPGLCTCCPLLERLVWGLLALCSLTFRSCSQVTTPKKPSPAHLGKQCPQPHTWHPTQNPLIFEVRPSVSESVLFIYLLTYLWGSPSIRITVSKETGGSSVLPLGAQSREVFGK